ncbi:MAG TPA: hypothetical protein VFN07_01015 [Trueperaceae bacterium]|nr:hypothetical protein [Trueperaceae bacterium]
MSLKSVLTGIRTSLKTATSVPVELRDELPLKDGAYQPPTSARHVIIDLVSTDPHRGLTGSVYEGIDVQIGAWSTKGVTDALDLAETCRSTLAGNYVRTGPVVLTRDEEWRGVLFTVSDAAAFDDFQ